MAPIDTTTANILMKQEDEDAAPVIVEPQKKPGFFQRLFGKHDTTATNKKDEKKALDPKEKLKAEIEKLKEGEKTQELLIDTAGKTKKEIRQEKRRLRQVEKDQEKALKDGNQ